MRIKITNIAVAGFGLLVLILLARHGRTIALVIGDINHIGPGHTADEKTVGLMALGFIGISLVAIVRLLTRSASERRERRHNQWDEPET